MKYVTKIAIAVVISISSCTVWSNQLATSFVKQEINHAHQEYLTGSTDSALYALKSLARILEFGIEQGLLAELGPNNLSFTYLRLGLLYEAQGAKDKADVYFNKALTSYSDKCTSVNKLKGLVKELDTTI